MGFITYQKLTKFYKLLVLRELQNGWRFCNDFIQMR